ncbi:MAG: hypothetical protein ABJB85_02995 [Nitrososphaerota archaeon]
MTNPCGDTKGDRMTHLNSVLKLLIVVTVTLKVRKYPPLTTNMISLPLTVIADYEANQPLRPKKEDR